MSVDRLQRYSGVPTQPIPGQASGPPASYEALPDGTALMIDFVLKNGDRVAISYAYLNIIRWNRSEGLLLEFVDTTVDIKGVQLEAVYTNLSAHRIFRMRERETAFDGEGGDTVITSILVKPRRREARGE